MASTAPQTRRAHTPPVQVVTAEVGTATTSTIAATTASPAVSTTVATAATAAVAAAAAAAAAFAAVAAAVKPLALLGARGRAGGFGGRGVVAGMVEGGVDSAPFGPRLFLAGSFYVFECIFAIALVMS